MPHLFLIKDGRSQVEDPADVEHLLDKLTGTTPEQRRRLQQEAVKRAHERERARKAENKAFVSGLFLGLLFGAPIGVIICDFLSQLWS